MVSSTVVVTRLHSLPDLRFTVLLLPLRDICLQAQGLSVCAWEHEDIARDSCCTSCLSQLLTSRALSID